MAESACKLEGERPAVCRLRRSYPKGPDYTTIVELGPKRPSLLWFWGPNSITVVYMDPLGQGAIGICHTHVSCIGNLGLVFQEKGHIGRGWIGIWVSEV